jgi:hypothetical protein
MKYCSNNELNLYPPRRSDCPVALGNLANALLALFGQSGQLGGSPVGYRSTLALRLLGDPNHVLSLINLANIGFQYTGELPILKEALAHNRSALVLLPPKHPNHSTYLSNLANLILNASDRQVSQTNHTMRVRISQNAHSFAARTTSRDRHRGRYCKSMLSSTVITTYPV